MASRRGALFESQAERTAANAERAKRAEDRSQTIGGGRRYSSMEELRAAIDSGQLNPFEALHLANEMQTERNNASIGQAAEQNSWEQAALAGMTPEQQATYRQQKAQNERYGSDISWLDPSFQMDPALLGQSAGSQVHADQNAINAQNQALGQAQGLSAQDLQFMSPAEQQGLLGSLKGIIDGGGATSIEMANRQAQRGDQEAWLRGQREADIANYAERGLTGSGMELLDLAADRQAAAGRNSLADLETAKALEERRLGAINSAAGLATNMRGQTAGEQVANRNARQTAINSAADMASGMRNQSMDEGSYRADAADAFSQLNNASTNAAKNANTQFLQNAYQQMMQSRVQQDMQNKNLNAQDAQNQQAFDQRENQGAANQAGQVGQFDANAFNQTMQQFQNAMTGASANSANNSFNAAMNGNQIWPMIGQWGGNIGDTLISMGAGAAGGGAAGAGGGSSGGLSRAGTTWAQSGQSQKPWDPGDSSTWTGLGW